MTLHYIVLIRRTYYFERDTELLKNLYDFPYTEFYAQYLQRPCRRRHRKSRLFPARTLHDGFVICRITFVIFLLYYK